MNIDTFLRKLQAKNSYYRYKKGTIIIDGEPPYSLSYSLDNKTFIPTELLAYAPDPLKYIIPYKKYSAILVYQPQIIGNVEIDILKQVIVSLPKKRYIQLVKK